MNKKLRVDVSISDPLNLERLSEPLFFEVDAPLEGKLWWARSPSGQKFVCQRIRAESTKRTTGFVCTINTHEVASFRLIRPLSEDEEDAIEGISIQKGTEADSVVRLDTGYFDLELCRGTAKGEGSSKWGIRHFASLKEGVDLLPSGNNAIGGFYGPFFTPENGLVNPPEHVIAEVEVVEEGPILHRYRLSGIVPDGLLPELRNKKFSVEWTFTYKSPHFARRYDIDAFETTINGRHIENKITVGDEFESGPGSTVFDRFQAYGGTRYRLGDEYAEQLAKMVAETLDDNEGTDRPDKFKDFQRVLQGDLADAHWDLYWRLFSVWELALSEDELRRRLDEVRQNSHRLADSPRRKWQLDGPGAPVDVSCSPGQTIFAGPASKTVEFDSTTGQAMVWWTSEPSGAFQIVQRLESGWVNWGTNGENECPELPTGVTIKTGYGNFADCWEDFADALETVPQTEVSLSEAD